MGDLVELWNGRSTDYVVLPAGPQTVAAHQQVADVFLQAGVLDGPARVAPLWDARYAALLARPHSAKPSRATTIAARLSVNSIHRRTAAVSDTP